MTITIEINRVTVVKEINGRLVKRPVRLQPRGLYNLINWCNANLIAYRKRPYRVYNDQQ